MSFGWILLCMIKNCDIDYSRKNVPYMTRKLCSGADNKCRVAPVCEKKRHQGRLGHTLYWHYLKSGYKSAISKVGGNGLFL